MCSSLMSLLSNTKSLYTHDFNCVFKHTWQSDFNCVLFTTMDIEMDVFSLIEFWEISRGRIHNVSMAAALSLFTLSHTKTISILLYIKWECNLLSLTIGLVSGCVYMEYSGLSCESNLRGPLSTGTSRMAELQEYNKREEDILYSKRLPRSYRKLSAVTWYEIRHSTKRNLPAKPLAMCLWFKADYSNCSVSREIYIVFSWHDFIAHT